MDFLKKEFPDMNFPKQMALEEALKDVVPVMDPTTEGAFSISFFLPDFVYTLFGDMIELGDETLNAFESFLQEQNHINYVLDSKAFNFDLRFISAGFKIKCQAVSGDENCTEPSNLRPISKSFYL